ncbi:tandem-95 repeat protein [Vibrio hippocampi]
MEEGPSGAGDSSDEGESAAKSSASKDSDGADSEASQSQSVGGSAESGATEDETGGGGAASGAGAQAIGGDSAEGSDGGSDAEGATQAQAQSGSAAPAATSSSDSQGEATEEDVDSETVSEDFTVDVQDSSVESISQVEDDFDSETTNTTFEVNVEGENDAPEAEDLAYTMEEDGVLVFTEADLLANASDIDGDELSVENVSYTGTDGVLTDNGDGTYSFAPNENFNGDVAFSFDVSDGTETVTANVDVQVTAVNDPPVAGATSYTVQEDNSITISNEQLLANSSDVEGEVAIENVSYSGTDGVFSDNGDGTYTFSPNENFSGDISLDVSVVDEDGATADTTAGIQVIEVNDPPIAGPTSYTIDEDSVLTFNESQVLANASDIDGEVELVGISYDGPDGVFSINGDGTCSFAPNENFNGEVQLNVMIIDDDGATVETVINVDVLPINDAPVSGSTAYQVDEDGSITISQEQLLSQSSDVEGDDLTASNLVVDGHAQVTANDDGSFTITPDADWNGDIDMHFDITDGTDTIQATADLTVNPVNDLPQPQDQAFSMEEDGTLVFTDADLLMGATDIDGDDLSVEGVSYSGTDGILTDNGDGTYSFAPNENFNGDVEFSFDVNDGTDTVSANIDVSVTPVDDAPTVDGNLAYSVNEDGEITLSQEQLLSNVSDVEGDDLTASNLSVDGNAEVTVNDDGSFTITPDADWNGDIDISFDVSDGNNVVQSQADLTVNPVNDLPQPQDQAFSMEEDGTLVFTDADLLTGATDIDGDDLSVEGVNYSGTDGILTDNGDGTYSFAPNENFNGDVEFSFDVNDGTDTVSANIDVSVTPVDDAPTVEGNLAYSVNEDGEITLSQEQLLSNVSDVEGDDLTASNLSVDGNAEVSVNDDGSFTITPDADWNGDIDISFDVSDGENLVASGADLTVNPVNDLPQPQDQAFSMEEDGTLVFTDADLLTGATDIDGDELSVEGVNYSGTDGILTDNGDGTYSFAPNENFNGDVEFSFDVNDGTDTVSANIDVSVTPVDDAPTVDGNLAYTVNEDGEITLSQEQLLSNVSDVEGDDLTASNLSVDGNAEVTVNDDGSFTITPDADWNGDIDISFDVSDGENLVASGADLTVNPVNDLPQPQDQAFSMEEDGTLVFTDADLLTGATDIDGDDLSVEGVSYSGTDGILTDNGDGTYSFAPNENFNGDVEFSFDVNDGTDTVSANIDVSVTPVDDAPTVDGNLAYTVNEDGEITLSQEQLLSNVSDVEGDDLTASNLSVDGNAEVTVNDDGSFTITPDADWNGDIDISFDVSDGENLVASGADLTVNPVNDLPQPQDQAFSMEEDGTLVFTDADLLTGATDIDGDELSVEGVNYSGTDGILTDNGDGTYSFAPNENFNGDVEFSFDVNDGTDTVSANIDVSVTPVDDAPTVDGNLAYTVNEDGEITLSQEQLLSNVSDVEGDDLTASNLSVDGNAEVTVNDDGSFTITPDADWNGDIDISFDVSDGENLVASGADLTVNPVNDLPQPQDQAFSMEEDGTLVFTDADLLTGATDIDGDDLSVEGVSYSGTDGILTDNGDGTYSFAPNENFNGDVEFSFDVNDGTDTVSANIDVSVTPVDDAPTVEGNLAYSVNEDGEITLSQEQLLSNVSDVEGDDLTASNLSVDGNAEVTVNDDGSFTITPDADWNGDIDISFDVSDGNNVVQSQADLTVNPVNDLPQPQDQAFSMEEDGTLVFTDADLLTGATDIDGDDLSVEGVSYSGTDGILTDNGDGTYSFAPNENFNGDVEFSFDVNDGTDTVSANIDVSVTPVDDAPTVDGNLAYSVSEDGEITLSQEQLLSNVSDVEGDDLTASNLSVDGNAEVTVNDDGSFTITPDADWNGDIDISFDVSDGNNVVQSQADLTVNPVNDLPQPQDQAFSMEEDGTLVFTDADLLTGATDIDGDDLSVESVNYSGTDGILTDNGDGTYSFAPNENFNGDVEFSFDVNDGTDTVSANIDVSVTPIDDAPTVEGNLAYSVNEDGEITLSQEQLLSNVSDVEGDDLTASNLSVDGNAEVTVNDDGSFTITPDADWNGDIDISFDVSDGENLVASGADLTVNPVNDLPQPQDQAFSMEEDGTLVFTDADLLTGATDIDGDDLSVESVNYSGTDGILTDNGDGTYSFAPNENFNGEVEFSFDVNDGTDTVSANIDVSVTPIDDAPTVEGNLAYSVNEDGEITISQEQLLSNVSDVEGDDLTASNLSVDGNAEVTVNNDGSFTITPDADWNGDIDISFDVSDGENLVASGADLTVNPVNDLPQPQDQAFSMEEDGTLVFTDADLLTGATDIDGDDLSVESVNYSGTDGILTDNGDGTYSFAPNENFNGDVEFSFDVNDGTDTVSANIDVSVTPVDDAPTVDGNLAYTVNEDGEITLSQEQLLSNVSDVEGDDLTASNLSVDGNAEVSVNDDGSFTITPDADWNGDIDISFDVSDGENLVASGADLTVNPVNDLPQPQDQAFSMEEDGTLVFTDADLLTGATDIDGDDLSVEGVSYSGTDGILTDNGDGTYSFAPNENFNGEVEFSFDVNDGTDTVSANIDVSVTPVDDAPTVEGNLAYSVNEDGEITLSQEQLLSNVSDVEGDDLTASNLSVDGNAEVTVNNDGSFTITPDADWNGDIDISFDVSDGNNVVQAEADLTVNPVNDLPQPQDQAFTIQEDGILTFTDAHLLQGATDIEGDNLSVEGISYEGTDGILTDNGNGTYSFAPNENFNGDVEFSFDVSDGTDTVSANIDVSVTPVDDAPTVDGNLAYSVNEDGEITLSQEQLLSNVSDVEGDDLTASNLSVDGNAEVTVNDDGSFTITPDADWNGDIDISFDVSDGENLVVSGADLTVNPVNDLPQPQDQAFTIQEDGILTFTDAHLLQGATDIDGDNLSVEGISYDGTDGILTDNGNGTYSFAPNENFNGDVEFSFDVSDGTDTVSANIDVSVTPVDDAPTVEGNLAYSVNEDGEITLSQEQLLSNVSDVEGDDLTASNLSVDGNAEVTVNDDGSFTITPDADWNGDIDISFDVSDGENLVVSGADLTVNPVNDLPQPQDQAFTIQEDGILTFTDAHLLQGATDIDGDNLSVEGISYDGTDGILTDNGNGTYSFAPNENFNGDVEFSFDVSDGTDTVSANIDVSVTPVDDAPVSGDLAYTVNEDGQITLSQDQLLSQATDVEGDQLTASNLAVDGNAEVTVNDDGSFTITPDADWNGDIDISFDISDGNNVVQAGADLTVNPVNDLPQPEDKSYMVEEDGTLVFTEEQLLQNATDIDGDNLEVSGVSYTGTDGILTDNGDGTYSFAPNENFLGDVQFTFDVTDGTDTVTANIDVTVTDVNDPPVAGATSYTVQEDHSITISDEQLLVNSSDIEGAVSVADVSYSGTDGVFVDNGNGTYTFSPNENFTGDISLDVTVADLHNETAETTATIDVIEVNDPPIAGDTAYSINEDQVLVFTADQLLAQSSDVEGEVALGGVSYSGSDGILTDNGNGTFSFAPNENFNGDVSLTVTVVDEDGATADATASIDVLPINDVPVTGSTSYQVNEDGSITISQEQLLSQTSDVEGDELTATNLIVDGNAEVTVNEDGSFTITPDADWNGDIDMHFDISDGTDTIQGTADLTVNPVNDLPQPQDHEFTIQEDGILTFTDEQLLQGATDIEGDNLTVEGVSYSGTDGILTDYGDGVYGFAPNENFNGEVNFSFDVSDGTDVVAANIDVNVTPVNDAPTVDGNLAYTINEDGQITLSQEQLLTHASDAEGDQLTAQNLSVNGNATVTENDDGSFTITPDADWNGDIDISFDVSDGDNVVQTSAELTVNPVNDAPDAGEELYIQAEEDQTVGVTLREEPSLRLDQAPEHGIIEANLNDEWVELEVGVEIPADTEVRFVANEEDVAAGTHTTQIGTFDDNASVDDWGTEVDPYTREYTDGDLTVTVQSNDDPLGAWNGNTHIGHGIGDTDRQGLSGDEKLTVSVEGQDINEISFHLDGLGGWFMEESRHFTEVEIKAFNDEGELIDSMTYHKEDRGSYETDYTLTVDQPVSYFELGTIQGNGTYVVQNMTVSQTVPDEAVFTSLGVDGTEITEAVTLQLHEGDTEIDLTADLPNLAIDSEGAGQFASVVITEEQLLAQATDIDSEDLDIQNLELVGDNAENATLTDNGDGTWTVTPDENFHGEIELGYQVTDGELTDDNIININFESVNDAPIVSGPIVLQTDEDEGITFSADDLLANSSDVEGDELSVTDISYSGENGELTDNGDGTYTFMPNENFNGEVDINYSVFDGTDTTETNLDLTVIPVNDVPVPGAPLHTQMLENGTIVIEAKDLLSGASDVDGDILHIENLLLVDQSQGTLTDNGDNTFTFEPATDFYGEVNLTFDISDGMASAPSTASIDVEIVNEGPEVSGPVEAVVDEDGSITITQEALLENASDLDGDNLEAINLQTNDPNATIVENADGSFTITPSENFFGEVEFTYDVTDAIEIVSTGLNLTVNPINDLPDVPDLSFTTEDGESIIVTQEQLLAQATDIEGDALTALNVNTDNPNVDVVDNGDGTFTLTPDEGYFGNADLTFDVSDGTDIVTANIDLKVEFVNDAPEAEAVAATVEEDGTILVTQDMLLENASDVDGDALFASNLTTNDPNAQVVDNGDGTFSVTPSENFNGEIQFDYEVNDGELSTTTQLNLDVTPVNDAPEVDALAFEMQEDGTLLITDEQLLANATDIDGDTLSVSNVDYSGDQGELVDNGDGTYSFTPSEHFSGDLQLGFTVSDGEAEVSQTLDVHVEAVADAPDLVVTDGEGQEVGGSTIVTEPGGTVELNIGASLVDQDLSETLTVEVDGIPEGTVVRYDSESVLNDQDNGITSYNDTEITVTFEGETAGFQNAAGYYKVDEDGNITGVEVVYENASQVGGGGDLLPGQSSFSFPIEEGESFNLFLIPNGFNHNDFDAMENGNFAFVDANGEPATMDTVDPQLIFVDENGDTTTIQGQFGDAVFHGGSSSDLNQDGIEHTRTTLNEDGELVYGFEDLYGGGDADYSDFNFTIDVGEVNSQIYSGELTVGEDGSVVIPTTAIDQTIEFVLPEGTEESFDINVTATATELSNDDTETVSQTITIDIEHAPEADAVSATVDEDGSIIITQEDLLANASDLDGDDLTALNLATDNENVTITDNGDGSYTLTPDADYNGDIDFTFDVSDGDQIVSTDLNLTVNPVNDAPVPEDKAYTVEEDGTLTFTDEQLLENAIDIDGDELSVEGVSYAGTDGILSDNGDGTYSFAPNENFSGDVELSFDVSDGTETSSASIAVQVTEVNDPPVAGPTSYTINEDSVLTFNESQVLANASDVDGEVSLVGISYDGPDGVFSINGDGTCSFAPNENFNGEVQLNVTITDDDGATVDTVINVDVLPINDVPVSGATSYQVNEDGSITISQEQLLSQTSDVEGDELTASNLIVDGNAVVTANDDGSFTIVPDADFNGDIDLHFDITDGTETIQATADLTVNPVNDLPESAHIEVQGTEDTTLLITQEMLLAQATDVDNTADELTAVGLNIDESFGDLVDNQDGTWSFTPTENFNGDVPMEFQVSDGDLTTTVSGNIDVAAVNDAPDAPSIQMQGEEDQLMVIDPSFITNQITDLDGDEISLENITVRAPANATVTQQPDGMFHLVTSQDYNGLVELGYTVTDGTESVEGSLNVDVIPVNDAPFNTGNAMMATDEDGAFTFDAGDLMNLFDDIDTENLVVSRIIMPDDEDGGAITDNGDGTWTFTPTDDFAGLADLQVVVSDGEFETALDVPVYVRPVADGAVITTEHDGPLVIGEDSSGHLGLNVDLIDDSETLSNLVMTGFPVGFEVSDGENTLTITSPDQYIDITEWNMSDLQITPPENFNGSFNVTVSATTVDYGDEPEAFEDGIDSGDFATVAGESILLTADDLMAIAENVDVDAGDEVKLVHLADRSQGEIVDNGDGTWTFNPADGFTGEVDIAYVIDKDGVLHDEQTGVVVSEPGEVENTAPEVQSITTTDLAPGATLEFTEQDMLANLSDADTDALSIESVSLMEGQGMIESDNEGNYQFTPADGYDGPVEIGFIATDGENRVESQFNVNLQGSSEISDGYVQADDGSIVIGEEQLLNELDVSPSAEVLDVVDDGDVGFFVDSGDSEWTFWPNDDFNGELPMKVEVNDNGSVTEHSLTVQAETSAVDTETSQTEQAQVETESQAESEVQPTDEAAVEAMSEDESDVDMTAAPGDTINIAIPDEVGSHDDVDHVEMSGLPDGSNVSGALDNGDGNYTISGDLSQPVSVELPEGFEGNLDVGFQGVDELGSNVDDAQASVPIEVDEQHTMSSSQNQDQNANQMDASEGSGGDWTSSGGQDEGVDFNDDSGSFDSDQSSNGGYENELDNHSF